MKLWKKNKVHKKTRDENSSRLNLVMAIVFLLAMATIYKLFNLQVEKYDLYSNLASSQHSISQTLEPGRGRIFIKGNDKSEDNYKLYPFATNKDFAFVYAVPKDVKDPRRVSEIFYTVFKKEGVIEEVDEYLKKEEEKKKQEEITYIENLGLDPVESSVKINEVMTRYESRKTDPTYLELFNIKREAEINKRKDVIVTEYMTVLKKEDDPYEPIKKKVDEDKLLALYALLLSRGENYYSPSDLDLKEGKLFLKSDLNTSISFSGVGYTMISYRYYPEKNTGSHMLGFVTTNDNKEGRYGLEGYFEPLLRGKEGSIKSEAGAGRSVIILNDREYVKPEDGSDLVLTIDRSVQYIVCSKLNQAAKRHGADSGSVIVMKPETGAIIAMCSWPDFDPNDYENVEDISIFNNPSIFDQYEPGSVFKTITMSAGLDMEKIAPETTYKDEGYMMINGWHKPIKNSDYATVGGHGVVDMNTVLEYSLNTGVMFVMKKTGPNNLADYIRKFGFGERTGIELATEEKGDLSNLESENIQEIYAATASFGQGITVTPLQMVSSYAAIANGGILMQPYLVDEIRHSDGTVEKTRPREIRRVISERAAMLVSGMLANVVEGGHAGKAKVEGYWVGGKTGTAQVASSEARGYGGKTIHTFVGFAPIEEPEFVMLVKLDDPKDVRYSASSAAPLFGEISKELLNYYQIPKERD